MWQMTLRSCLIFSSIHSRVTYILCTVVRGTLDSSRRSSGGWSGSATALTFRTLWPTIWPSTLHRHHPIIIQPKSYCSARRSHRTLQAYSKASPFHWTVKPYLTITAAPFLLHAGVATLLTELVQRVVHQLHCLSHRHTTASTYLTVALSGLQMQQQHQNEQ